MARPGFEPGTPRFSGAPKVLGNVAASRASSRGAFSEICGLSSRYQQFLVLGLAASTNWRTNAISTGAASIGWVPQRWAEPSRERVFDPPGGSADSALYAAGDAQPAGRDRGRADRV
jgi:hypothetical protein